jgi:hypothetical protein
LYTGACTAMHVLSGIVLALIQLTCPAQCQILTRAKSVETAQDLQQAIESAVPHIRITKHLNLTELHTFNIKESALFQIEVNTKSIVVRPSHRKLPCVPTQLDALDAWLLREQVRIESLLSHI